MPTPTPPSPTPRVAIFLSFSGDGGVERMMLNLAGAMARLGVAVDLVHGRSEGGHVAQAPEGVRMVPLGARHSLTSIPGLVRYLRRNRPDALLAAKDRGNRAALQAVRLARTGTPTGVRLGNNLSGVLQGRDPLHRRLRARLMHRAYQRADAIIAVSRGVAEDTAAVADLPREAIRVLPNPVITPALHRRAGDPPETTWPEGDGARLLGVGRLDRQKDFATLLRAFARLRQRRPARLLILGEGPERPRLEALAADLGVADAVALPGFATNPYPALARADLFVLSSAWEGSPNALTEALALGTPAVATDCPSGPREILADGELGPLVPVGDADALADAMAATLADPPDPDRLRAGVERYRDTASARAYLAVLGVTPPT
ncbi:glycosyltransferase [Thiohalorhabdus sp.]|uniref:glycosyltransferase n=1 Tax=Thiohalorhabdus sp. TaxID=3094134 RepID=UPI002FC36ED0